MSFVVRKDPSHQFPYPESGFLYDLSRGGNNFTSLPGADVEPSKSLEDCTYFMARQSRARTQTELSVDVFCVEEEDTLGRVTVPPGTPCFLQVVFKGTRHITMNDETDVRFIYAHAKGVCCSNDAQFTNPERLLNIALFFRAETGMITFRGEPLLLQNLCNALSRASRGAVDDSSGRSG